MELAPRKIVQILIMLIVIMIVWGAVSPLYGYVEENIGKVLDFQDEKLGWNQEDGPNVVFKMTDGTQSNFYKFKDDEWRVCNDRKTRNCNDAGGKLKGKDLDEGIEYFKNVRKGSSFPPGSPTKNVEVYKEDEKNPMSWDEFEKKWEKENKGKIEYLKGKKLRNTGYDLDANVDKMPDEVKKTYENLESIDIKSENMNAKEYLVERSKEENLNPALPLVVVTQESRGDPKAVSSTGCAGLFQFCYDTAYDNDNYNTIFGEKGNRCDGGDSRSCVGDPRFDPKKSIKAGVKKLSYDASVLENNILLTLTAYNAGPTIAKNCKDKIGSEDDLKECIMKETKDTFDEAKKKEVEDYLAKISSNYNTMVS